MTLLQQLAESVKTGEFHLFEKHRERVGYVKLTPPLIDEILRHDTSWVEIGAGTGALAKAIEKSGGDVEAYDDYSWKADADWVGRYHTVIALDAVEAVRSSEGKSVLMVWPPNDAEWTEKVLDEMVSGQILCYIGELQDGCTATNTFADRITDKDEFEMLSTFNVDRFKAFFDSGYVVKKR